MATPKLKIIVRLNEPHSPYGDVHRRRIPEALREPQACVPALSDPTVENFVEADFETHAEER